MGRQSPKQMVKAKLNKQKQNHMTQQCHYYAYTLLLLLLLSRFSRVQLCATPGTVACGFSVHGIIQARVLEWVAISFSSIYP